jgi:uncharacterized membrane protein
MSHPIRVATSRPVAEDPRQAPDRLEERGSSLQRRGASSRVVRTWFRVGASCGALALAACSDFGEPVSSGNPGPVEPPTWVGQVRGILAEHCVPCHGSPPVQNAPATFRLDKYDASDGADAVQGAFEQAARIRARTVLQRTMPPGGGVPAEQRNAIDAWVIAGAPRE